MDKVFDKLVKEMPQLLERLKKQRPRTRKELAGIPEKGVYVFYDEKNEAMYVGRSNHLKERIQQHGKASSNHDTAPFAYKLAVETMKARGVDISQRKDVDRTDFTGAKDRVSEMRVRVIEITCQKKQALFEIYAILELETEKYNDFKTS